jgi:hypothetical protein
MSNSLMYTDAYRHWETKLATQIEEMRVAGQIREGLAAMASTLQTELTAHDTAPTIQYSSALDLIMRGVAHTIANPSDFLYIRSKLGYGWKCLDSWMPKSKKS